MPAGTMTVTKSAFGRKVQRVVLDWTADGGGAVEQPVGLVGRIARVTFDPAGGDEAPTDNYDVTLLDAEGVDLLAGLGADRDTANTETVYPLLGSVPDVPAFACGPCTLTVASAGAANAGRVVLYLGDQ